jgi:hypothetical protein
VFVTRQVGRRGMVRRAWSMAEAERLNSLAPASLGIEVERGSSPTTQKAPAVVIEHPRRIPGNGGINVARVLMAVGA